MRRANKGKHNYIVLVTFLTFIFPIVAAWLEVFINHENYYSFYIFSKWFIFFAVGIRLTIAGMKQVFDPRYTAVEIFKMKTAESFPVIRELGFANLCFGLIAILSVVFPQWRIVSAFGSGIYYAIAGIQHLLKRPSSINEEFALITDLLIAIGLLIYFFRHI